jgi:CheY-like chemotaxis protein
MSSVPRELEELIEHLRLRTFGKTVSMYGFDVTAEDALNNQANQLLKASVANFLENWYGLKIIPYGEKCDIIVANEADASTLIKLAKPFRGYRSAPAVLSLCSPSARFNRTPDSKVALNVGVLAKPIGPLKLARALGQCLDGTPVTTTPGLEKGTDGASMETNDLVDQFEDLSLSPNGGSGFLDTSRMAADSNNARKALESPTPNANAEKQREFPFPSGDDKSIDSTIKGPKSLSPGKENTPSIDAAPFPTSKDDTASSTSVAAIASQKSISPQPRLLLVDDNKINLNLLRMYMIKRKYKHVKEAENGQEAVNAVQLAPDGYFNIIFMDISMPVLDGFGATRQIRQIEHERQEKARTAGLPIPTPALIIALTGLASSRDQSEAFTSGIDLFLTKPVAFKEVGKMLDNWVANEEKESEEETVVSDKQSDAVSPIPKSTNQVLGTTL